MTNEAQTRGATTLVVQCSPMLPLPRPEKLLKEWQATAPKERANP